MPLCLAQPFALRSAQEHPAFAPAGLPSGRKRRFACRAAGLLLLCLFCAANAGCASRESAEENNRRDFSFAHYALDGPELAVVGRYSGMRMEGTLERSGMVGMGNLHLEGREPSALPASTVSSASPVSPAPVQTSPLFVCDGAFKTQPTEKGRVRGVLACTGGRQIYVTLRNLGPDQGLGVGREARNEGGADNADLLVLFFHPSREEALRRFPAVLRDMEAVRAKTHHR